MNNLKDTKNNNLEVQKKSLPLVNYASGLVKQTPAKKLADKAQKIITAVYLITDIRYIKDSLRESIRQKSLDVLEALLHNYSVDFDSVSLNKAQHDLYAMLSYVDVVYKIGGISEMNYSVLLKETHALHESIYNQIHNHKKQDNLDLKLSDLFNREPLDENKVINQKSTEKLSTAIEPKTKAEKVASDVVSPLKKLSSLTVKKQGQKKESKKTVKEKRHSDIISILEQKKNASIKDICLLFKDCSSKTIQRDLNMLIDNKKVVKRGDRRWAVYNLAR